MSDGFGAPASGPRTPVRGLRRGSFYRASAAILLLAGLFALFFLYLGRDSGTGSTPPAVKAETPTGDGDVSPGIHAGSLARNFEATNLNDLRFRLSDLRGRPVVINFWATWCTSCLAEMPALEAQRIRHESDGLTILAVNVGEGFDDARSFIEALELFEFAIGMDPDLTVTDMYAVQGLPHSIFLDSEGVIQAEYRGQLDEDTMEGYVRAAIDAVPGAPAPIRLRFVTTVPREHILDVLPDEDGADGVVFVSRSLRCSEEYCAEPVVDAVGATNGVTAVELRTDEPTPALSVSFDPTVIALSDLVDLVARELQAMHDPLYTRELEVRYPDGQP